MWPPQQGNEGTDENMEEPLVCESSVAAPSPPVLLYVCVVCVCVYVCVCVCVCVCVWCVRVCECVWCVRVCVCVCVVCKSVCVCVCVWCVRVCVCVCESMLVSVCPGEHACCMYTVYMARIVNTKNTLSACTCTC